MTEREAILILLVQHIKHCTTCLTCCNNGWGEGLCVNGQRLEQRAGGIPDAPAKWEPGTGPCFKQGKPRVGVHRARTRTRFKAVSHLVDPKLVN